MKIDFKEIVIILLAIVVLSLAIAYPDKNSFSTILLFIVIIILVNIITKKSIGYFFEAHVKTKFWSWRQFGFAKNMHFKKVCLAYIVKR